MPKRATFCPAASSYTAQATTCEHIDPFLQNFLVPFLKKTDPPKRFPILVSASISAARGLSVRTSTPVFPVIPAQISCSRFPTPCSGDTFRMRIPSQWLLKSRLNDKPRANARGFFLSTCRAPVFRVRSKNLPVRDVPCDTWIRDSSKAHRFRLASNWPQRALLCRIRMD